MRAIFEGKAILSTLACIACILCGGCSPGRVFSKVHGDQFDNAFPDGELLFIERSITDISEGTPAMPSIDSDKDKRNRYISVKMFEIDRSYFQFVTLLNATDTGVVTFADFAQLGLTTAATAIPVVQTTKVLATAATAVGGAKAVYNENLLRTQTIQAIQTQMDADRAKVKNIIVARMDKCDYKKYPIGFVLSDLQAYASAGTPDSALTSLNNSATKAKQSAVTQASTASADGGGGGAPSAKASDQNSKSVDVPGGKLTYTFRETSPCPINSTS